ncbi:MAG: hypothetical protein V1800_15320 [Candidatus Latescibacterota bacterium]
MSGQTRRYSENHGALVQDDRWVNVPDLPTHFADYIHWPITRGYGTTPLTDTATYRERPTHTFPGYANNAPAETREDGAVTWTWLLRDGNCKRCPPAEPRQGMDGPDACYRDQICFPGRGLCGGQPLGGSDAGYQGRTRCRKTDVCAAQC